MATASSSEADLAQVSTADGALVEAPGRWTVSEVLRIGGGAALVLALAQFLLVGVDARDDLHRFALLLVQTGLFTGGAFLLQRVFDDRRSARLLIGIALLSVVAGMTVLGAMLYAWLPLDGQGFLRSTGLLRADGSNSAYPSYARWQASGVWQLALAALGAFVVLVPTMRFAFAVLARRSAATLTLLMGLASTVLLIPVRDPALVGVLVAANWLLVRYGLRGLVERDAGLSTVEGRVARAMPYLPALIVAARALLMYEPGALFVMPIALTVWALIRLRPAPLSSVHYALGAGAVVVVALVLSELMEPSLDLYVLPLVTTVSALGIADLRVRAPDGRSVKVVDSMLLLSALVPLSLAMIFAYLSPATSLLPLLATLPLLGFALFTGRRWTCGLIVLSLLWQSMMVIETVIALLSHHGWQSLLVIGLLAVTSAAWLERRGGLATLVPQLTRRAPRPSTQPDRPAAIEQRSVSRAAGSVEARTEPSTA